MPNTTFHQDLLTALPRFFRGTGNLAFAYLPDQIDSLFSMVRGTKGSNATLVATTVARATAPQAEGRFSDFVHGVFVEPMLGFDGVFSYIASRWSLATFIIAVALNRARVYSASRRRLSLRWHTRLALRIWPILLLASQMLRVLQTIRCQTGDLLVKTDANTAGVAWNDKFAGDGGFLYSLSSNVLFWQPESDSCLAAGMITASSTKGVQVAPRGSAATLWPMFLSLCSSHLIETISCALEGRQVAPETAMTLFEHSLAFAEAEAVVRDSLGLGLFGLRKEQENRFQNWSRSMVLQRSNVPSDVLLVTLLSSCSHVSSQILGVFKLQSKFRLVNTTIWGLSFVSVVFWSFVRYARYINGSNIGALRYPTVCMIGFIPHLIIILSIILCSTIYAIALLVTLVNLPSPGGRMSWKQRIALANDNLQASLALSNITIRWSDEFYTTLLKIGFSILTAASEAVFFNEGISVAVSETTWLEKKRMEALDARTRRLGIPSAISGPLDIAEGLDLVDKTATNATSGYGRERSTAKVSAHEGVAATREDGVGGSQRSGRWLMSWLLVQQNSLLSARLAAKVIVRGLQRFQPHLLKQGLYEFAFPLEAQAHNENRTYSSPWRSVNAQKWRHLVDFESETLSRLRAGELQLTPETVDSYLYDSWKSGPVWGETDMSEDYAPSIEQDDTTSMISASDAQSIFSIEDDEDDGSRTPTQSRRTFSRSPTPEDTLSTLSRLLDPQTQEDKNEARLLSSILKRPGPLTRSQLQRERGLNNLRLLAGRHKPPEISKLSPEDEERQLESLILSRRAQSSATSSSVHTQHTQSPSTPSTIKSWLEGGDGMGADGPVCVVCQTSPRTILVWPCRCLCLCEQCRVSLALGNYKNCVTCRRDVVAFSRLYVP